MTNSEDYGARVRAARAYTGLKERDFAEAVGIGERTIDRIIENERDLRLPEARRIAEKTGVPLSFLVDGWTIARTVEERLTQIEQQLAELTSRDAGQLSDAAMSVIETALRRSAPAAELSEPQQPQRRRREDQRGAQ